MRKLAIALGIVSLGIGAAYAQSRQPATLDDLLAEMKALRADLAASSDAQIRAQLLVARLQLQEQRTRTVIQELNDARSAAKADQDRADDAQRQFDRMQEVIADPSRVEPAAREMMVREARDRLPGLKDELTRAQARAQSSQARTTTLEGRLTEEQARWNEFNDRLDAIERSLQKR